MAMITIERIVPAGNSSSSSSSSSSSTTTASVHNNSSRHLNQQDDRAIIGHLNNEQANTSDSTSMIRLSEIYIAVRDADIIFPHNECHRYSRTAASATTATISELIQKHLKAILEILRPEDTMKMVCMSESVLPI